MISSAFGPGSSVLITGFCHSVVGVIGFLLLCCDGCYALANVRASAKRCPSFVRASALAGRVPAFHWRKLVAAEEIGAFGCRAEFCDATRSHLTKNTRILGLLPLGFADEGYRWCLRRLGFHSRVIEPPTGNFDHSFANSSNAAMMRSRSGWEMFVSGMMSCFSQRD